MGAAGDASRPFVLSEGERSETESKDPRGELQTREPEMGGEMPRRRGASRERREMVGGWARVTECATPRESRNARAPGRARLLRREHATVT